MSNWRLFLLPEGPFFERQFITKEAAIVFIQNNLFFRSDISKPILLAAPDTVIFVTEEYTEVEKCLFDIVEVE
jgi:hypothetical protein